MSTQLFEVFGRLGGVASGLIADMCIHRFFKSIVLLYTIGNCPQQVDIYFATLSCGVYYSKIMAAIIIYTPMFCRNKTQFHSTNKIRTLAHVRTALCLPQNLRTSISMK